MAGRKWVLKDNSTLYRPPLLETPEGNNSRNCYRPALLQTPDRSRSVSPINMHRRTLLNSPDRSRSRSPLNNHRTALLSSPDRSPTTYPIDFHRPALLSSPDRSRTTSPTDFHRTTLLSSPDRSRSTSPTDFHRTTLLSSPDRSRSASPTDFRRTTLLQATLGIGGCEPYKDVCLSHSSSPDRSRSRSPIDLYRPALLSTPSLCNSDSHSSSRQDWKGKERSMCSDHYQNSSATTGETLRHTARGERSRLDPPHTSDYNHCSRYNVERFEYDHVGNHSSVRDKNCKSFSLIQAERQFESGLTTADEIGRLEQLTRQAQVNIYKQSKDYELFDRTFPRDGQHLSRPSTPDTANSNSQWMLAFTEWKNNISQLLQKGCHNARLVMDEEMLIRRQKNIDYGKTNDSYSMYIALVPKNRRSIRDPRTPDKSAVYSRRAWDGAIKSWKKRIHERVKELTEG